MKKKSFTKIIMATMICINIAVIVFICVMVWRTNDLSPAPYLAIGESGAISVWLAAYAWKEKAANRSKYAMEFVDKIADRYGPDIAVRISEVVLRE